MPQLVLDLEDDLYAAIEARAQAQFRTVSDQIRWELTQPTRRSDAYAHAISRLEQIAAAVSGEIAAAARGMLERPSPDRR
jgi:hypothetical protein